MKQEMKIMKKEFNCEMERLERKNAELKGRHKKTEEKEICNNNNLMLHTALLHQLLIVLYKGKQWGP